MEKIIATLELVWWWVAVFFFGWGVGEVIFLFFKVINDRMEYIDIFFIYFFMKRSICFQDLLLADVLLLSVGNNPSIEEVLQS